MENAREEIEKGIRAGVRILLDAATKEGKTRADIDKNLPEFKHGILLHPDMNELFETAGISEAESISMIDNVVNKAIAEYYG